MSLKEAQNPDILPEISSIDCYVIDLVYWLPIININYQKPGLSVSLKLS